MSEKVTIYENKDLFQQLCNCCPISANPIKNYKLDITLSNGQNQVLRLCDEHLNELEKAINDLKYSEEITNNFAINIRKLRNGHKLTQKQLAEILDKKESTVRMWELNKNEPSLTTLIKLSRLFSVSLDVMIGVNE